MALVAFLRGVNVGGHKTFRPSLLAERLRRFGVTSVGAAGTFIVKNPGSAAQFRAALLRSLPVEAEIMLCTKGDLLRIGEGNPFGTEAASSDVVRFVSILARAARPRSPLPAAFPADGDWRVRVVAAEGRYAFGMYRRHMETIRFLGQLDRLFSVPVTTRNWNTIQSVVRALKEL